MAQSKVEQQVARSRQLAVELSREQRRSRIWNTSGVAVSECARKTPRNRPVRFAHLRFHEKRLWLILGGATISC